MNGTGPNNEGWYSPPTPKPDGKRMPEMPPTGAIQTTAERLPMFSVPLAATRLVVGESTVRRRIRTGKLPAMCVEVYARLYPYRDRVLSPEESAAIPLSPEACPTCEGHFAFDGAALHFVRLKASRHATDELGASRVLSSLRARIGA